MKILWLNDDLTDAVLTRGRWWWKRVARVKLVSTRYSIDWQYDSGEPVGLDLNDHLKSEAYAERERQVRTRRERNWSPVKALPEARTVRR